MKPIRVLALSRYSALGASSRLRMIQFIKPLAEKSIIVDLHPLFSDEYLQKHYNNVSAGLFTDILLPTLKRLKILLSASRYDVIWLQQEAFPFIPWFFEQLGARALPPIIMDCDDAIFHRYDKNPSRIIRHFLGRKIDHVMATSQIVFAGNRYLAERAKNAGAKNVEHVPTVLDPSRYRFDRAAQPSHFRVGWVGTKSTSNYLYGIAPALARAQKELGAEVVVIGAKGLNIPGVTLTYIEWTEDTEASEIEKLSIGIMPLADTPWEYGKCGYKLLQYMACGLPVVASPIGANKDIVTEAATGFLPTSNTGWFDALKTIHDNRELAAAFGLAGRKRVESSYSINTVLPVIERGFRLAAGGINSRVR